MLTAVPAALPSDGTARRVVAAGVVELEIVERRVVERPAAAVRHFGVAGRSASAPVPSALTLRWVAIPPDEVCTRARPSCASS